MKKKIRKQIILLLTVQIAVRLKCSDRSGTDGALELNASYFDRRYVLPQ